MIEGNADIVQHHVVATGGAHAQRVPGAFYAQARRFGRHQKSADTRLGFLCLGPDNRPGKTLNACRIDLASADRPTIGGAARERCRETAAHRRAELRLNPQRVDQSAMFDGILDDAAHKLLRPAPVGQCGEVDVLHDQNKRCRGLSPRNETDDLGGFFECGSTAAQFERGCQRQQARFVQPVKIGARKRCRSIHLCRCPGKLGGHPAGDIDRGIGDLEWLGA
jgi:hypothetical protein